MGMFESDSLLCFTIIIYLTAALVALVFSGQQSRSILLTQGLCMLAGISGAASALVFLLDGSESFQLSLFVSSIPFLSMDIAFDGLSAFFLLILSILVFCVSLYSVGYLSHYIGKRNIGITMLGALLLLSLLTIVYATVYHPYMRIKTGG